MRIYLECLIADEGEVHRFRILKEEIPVEEYDVEKHWKTQYAWEELYPPPVDDGHGNLIRVSTVRNMIRVWTTPDCTAEEREWLLANNKITILSDLPNKSEVTYEGNKPNGSSL